MQILFFLLDPLPQTFQEKEVEFKINIFWF